MRSCFFIGDEDGIKLSGLLHLQYVFTFEVCCFVINLKLPEDCKAMFASIDVVSDVSAWSQLLGFFYSQLFLNR